MPSLTQTTLSAAIAVNQTTFTVASTSDIKNPSGGFKQKIYVIDPYSQKGELMIVESVPSSGVVSVTRLDQFKAPHASGSIVLIAGLDPTLGATFYEYNPSGYAVADPGFTSPWVNVLTGEQWLFSSITNTWVRGFNSAGGFSGPTAAHASGTAAMVISGPLFHVTGSSAVTSITMPVGYAGGPITVISDGAWTWTTGACTAASVGAQVAGTTVQFQYDFAAAKWVASGRA
jgi:hypothetical protein